MTADPLPFCDPMWLDEELDDTSPDDPRLRDLRGQGLTAIQLHTITDVQLATDHLTERNPMTIRKILDEIADERARQDARWGEQNHPDGTGIADEQRKLADNARATCQQVFAEGRGDWAHILFEEVREALAESDPAKLRAELIQVAAVAAAWAEAIDRRQAAHGRAA